MALSIEQNLKLDNYSAKLAKKNGKLRKQFYKSSHKYKWFTEQKALKCQ